MHAARHELQRLDREDQQRQSMGGRQVTDGRRLVRDSKDQNPVLA
jgi:hypothetical protein